MLLLHLHVLCGLHRCQLRCQFGKESVRVRFMFLGKWRYPTARLRKLADAPAPAKISALHRAVSRHFDVPDRARRTWRMRIKGGRPVRIPAAPVRAIHVLSTCHVYTRYNPPFIEGLFLVFSFLYCCILVLYCLCIAYYFIRYRVPVPLAL